MPDEDIQFDIDDTEPRIVPQVETPKLIQFVTKYSFGLIKDERQANYTLFIFCIVAFSMTIYLFFNY